MHRITEERGTCKVTALAAPVRVTRTVMLRDVAGEAFESLEWVTEAEWQTVGALPGSSRRMHQLACSHCGQVGRMVTLERFLYPGGYTSGAPREEKCPMCRNTVKCIAVTDSI
jgi:hypothetical protein